MGNRTGTNDKANEAAAMVGGPGITPMPGTAPAPAAPSAAEVVEDKPLYTGMFGSVKTQEELIDYVKKAEAKAVEATLGARPAPEAITPAPAVQAPKPIEEQIEEELFHNPREAIKKLRESIKDEIRTEDRAADAKKNAERNFWVNFYNENPDLKPLEDVVRSVVGANNAELKPLKLTEAKKFIADKARQLISTVRGGEGVVETEVPADGGAVIASTAGGSPKKVLQKPAAPLNFVEQVKRMQSRGQK